MIRIVNPTDANDYVPLLQPDTIEDSEIEAALRAYRMDDLNSLFCPRAPVDADLRTVSTGRAQPRVGLPRPNYSDVPPLGINQLYWPTGANRFARFVGLVELQDYLKILKFSGVDDGNGNRKMRAVQLMLAENEVDDATVAKWSFFSTWKDGAESRGLSTGMWLLDPRPIAIVPSEKTYYLLPLVDDRYWWQMGSMPHRAPRAPESWLGWLGQFQTIVDPRDPKAASNKREFTVDLVPSKVTAEYVAPDAIEFSRPLETMPVVLDAYAHSLGRRAVRGIDGNVQVVDVATSETLHAVNIQNQQNMAGGLIYSPSIAKTSGGALTAPSADKQALTTFARSIVVPEFIDVVFRKCVEWDQPDVTDLTGDTPQTRAPGTWGGAPTGKTQVLYGPGVRVIRISLPGWFNAKDFSPGVSQTIYTPSWVGRVFFEVDGTKEPKGEKDDAFYGDRYFRLAKRIAQDWLDWHSQRHEYEFAGLQTWRVTGFDDYVLWDMRHNQTHVKSQPYDFGVDTQLVQVHRQCDYRPDFFMGLVSSEWTLHPKELEPRTTDGFCSLQGASGPETEIWLDPCETGLDTDYWARSWEWMSARARPLIPCDPWAAETSIEYGKRFAHLGDPVTVTVRSHKLVQQLKSLLGCAIVTDESGAAVLDTDGNVIFDRTDCLPTANGLVTAERYGCEWVVTSIECN